MRFFSCDQLTRRANQQKSVQPYQQKYSAFAVGQISDLTPRVSPKRGAGRDRQVRCGGMRWTLMSRRRTWLTRTAKSCGPGARRWRQVRETQASHGRRWQKSPSHRGDHEVSRKPLRREGRSVSAEPVCSCAFSLCIFAHETAGAARTRLSLRPLLAERVKSDATLGHVMPRECGPIPSRCLTAFRQS
jgi:hypothetical protein